MLVVRNLNKMEMVDATAEFQTAFPTSYSPGVDKNSKKIPHLAGPPASGGSLWHLLHPGMDINGGKVPYLAEKQEPFSGSSFIHVSGRHGIGRQDRVFSSQSLRDPIRANASKRLYPICTICKFFL